MSVPKHRITVLGLGPGDISRLTLEAVEILEQAARLYVRTAEHPTVQMLPARFPYLELQSFDDVYEAADTIEEVYGRIVGRLLELADEADVLYGVPGSPAVDETTVRLLRSLAASQEQEVRIVQGLSYIEPALALVQDFDADWLQFIDAATIDLLESQNALGEVPGKPGHQPVRIPAPTAPLLISQVESSHLATSVKLWLTRYWPEDHEVSVVRHAATPSQAESRVALFKLDRIEVDHLTAVYVPPLAQTQDIHTFAGLLNVTRTLRAPGGCPWDREQSHDSLKTHLIEEAYEVLHSLDERNYTELAEELGDLLFQITIHSQIAAERDEFSIEDVIGSITKKLIRRHPHVFSDLDLPTSAAVLQRWESFKQAEKPQRTSILSSIPTAMPALPYSYAVQRRAANQGFEWPTIDALLEKAREELAELEGEVMPTVSRERALEELGDLLFVLVSAGRRLKIDPEEALRSANRKFVHRFQQVEAQARAGGRALKDLSAEELDVLWNEAKGSPIGSEAADFG